MKKEIEIIKKSNCERKDKPQKIKDFFLKLRKTIEGTKLNNPSAEEGELYVAAFYAKRMKKDGEIKLEGSIVTLASVNTINKAINSQIKSFIKRKVKKGIASNMDIMLLDLMNNLKKNENN